MPKIFGALNAPWDRSETSAWKAGSGAASLACKGLSSRAVCPANAFPYVRSFALCKLLVCRSLPPLPFLGLLLLLLLLFDSLFPFSRLLWSRPVCLVQQASLWSWFPKRPSTVRVVCPSVAFTAGPLLKATPIPFSTPELKLSFVHD